MVSNVITKNSSVSIKSWKEQRGKVESVQFSSVAQSCPTLCDPMNHSTPGLPVRHQLPEFTHVHWVGDAIQPSHPQSPPSPPAPNPSQHQSLFQWVSSSHEVAKVLKFQLQHHSFQRNPRVGLAKTIEKSKTTIACLIFFKFISFSHERVEICGPEKMAVLL